MGFKWIFKIIGLTFFYPATLAESSAESSDTQWEPCSLLVTDQSYDRAGGVRLWPNGLIPYTIDDNFRDSDREVFDRAINDFHHKTCLRFEPKSPNDPDHIHMQMRFENRSCGGAHLCLQNIGAQYIHIKHDCSWVSVFVHEMCHAACLDHEHARVDRDEFLEYSKCDNPNKIEKIEDRWTTRFQRYDYFSTMHYYCFGCNGIPTKPGVKECGSAVNKEGLSVIDADKLNEMYKCQGCYRHRWYRVDTLTAKEEASLVNFAAHLDNHEPAYLCRAFVGGSINTGKYVPSEKACDVSYFSDSQRVIAKDIQLFGLPPGSNIITNETAGYRLVYPEDFPFSSMIPVGRSSYNEKVYAVAREIEDNGGQKLILLGSMYPYRPTSGFFFRENQHIKVSHRDTDKIEFYAIGCS